MSERIVLAGASGFIGRHLAQALLEAGFDVLPLSRSGKGGVSWDGKTVGPWAASLEGARAIINLAGAPINGRWTPDYKRELLTSRLEPTLAIADAIKLCSTPPKVWVNASAVGYYGDHATSAVDERALPGTDFLADLCMRWERAALDSGAPTEVKLIRIGFVLGKDGGALPILLKLTRAFLGGAVGGGRQSVSWIHIEDLCRMFVAAASQPGWPQIANGSAPHPVTNGQLMAALRREVDRPWIPGPPAFLMHAVGNLTGQSAPALALASQRAVPRAALEANFPFLHPQVDEAICDLLK